MDVTTRLEQEALCYWIENCKNNIDGRFSAQVLTEATELVLKNSIFMFNNRYSHRIKDTAMGTKIAPIYAKLTLEFLRGNVVPQD